MKKQADWTPHSTEDLLKAIKWLRMMGNLMQQNSMIVADLFKEGEPMPPHPLHMDINNACALWLNDGKHGDWFFMDHRNIFNRIAFGETAIDSEAIAKAYEDCKPPLPVLENFSQKLLNNGWVLNEGEPLYSMGINTRSNNKRTDLPNIYWKSGSLFTAVGRSMMHFLLNERKLPVADLADATNKIDWSKK